jgi:glutathione peroxidase-family protein
MSTMGLSDFSATTLAGDEVALSTLAGKPTLILNVASL